MEVSVSKQGAVLLTAFFMGFGWGLGYDIIRPVRRRCRRKAAAVLDVLFASVSGIFLFLFAMGADSGKLGVWELSAAFLGFVTYIHTLSDFLLPVFSTLYRLLYAFYSKAGERLGTFSKRMKKTFKKGRK